MILCGLRNYLRESRQVGWPIRLRWVSNHSPLRFAPPVAEMTLPNRSIIVVQQITEGFFGFSLTFDILVRRSPNPPPEDMNVNRLQVSMYHAVSIERYGMLILPYQAEIRFERVKSCGTRFRARRNEVCGLPGTGSKHAGTDTLVSPAKIMPCVESCSAFAVERWSAEIRGGALILINPPVAESMRTSKMIAESPGFVVSLYTITGTRYTLLPSRQRS